MGANDLLGVAKKATFDVSEVYVSGGNGYGSVQGRFRRFVNVNTNTGTAIKYTDSSINGGEFKIMEDGYYWMLYCDLADVNTSRGFGISKNADGTIGLESIPRANLLANNNSPITTLGISSCCITYLKANDLVHAHASQGTVASANQDYTIYFRIIKLPIL